MLSRDNMLKDDLNKIKRDYSDYLDDEIALELVEFWIKEYPKNLRHIPKKLKKKITHEQAMNLQKPYRERGRLTLKSLKEMKNNILERLTIKKTEEQRYEQYERWEKKSTKINRRLLYVNIALVIITFIVGLGSLYFSNQSLELTRQQLEALSPIEPTLNIIPVDDGDDLFFPTFLLADMRRTIEGDIQISKERIEFVIRNYGQMDTGPINFELTSNWIWDRYAYLPNIERLSSEKIEFEFWYKGCSEDSTKCLRENVPTGNQILTLKIKCDSCERQLIEQNFTVCVWDQNKTKECKELWNPSK